MTKVFLEGVLSTQNNFEGQQNPYLASFCHSQALHPMISLACQIFSTLQIQRIMARSLPRRRFSVSTFMAQVSAACSITLLTHDEYTLSLVRRGRWRLVSRGSNWRNLPHAHLQHVIAATSCREHVPKVAELWDNFKLFVSNLNL